MDAAEDGAQQGSIEGHVEQLDELFGVSGWAIDRANPGSALTVELWAGDVTLATAQTGLSRADVCDSLELEGNPGFRFDDAVRDSIRGAAEVGLGGDLIVRVAGDERPLSSLAGARSLELVRLAAMGDTPANHDALIQRLSFHARTARTTFDQPLRPTSGKAFGFVESIAVDDSGVTWVVGWMKRDLVCDRPLVIVDNGKFAAGFAYTLVRRDDLPDDSMGFVGILHTDWRASRELPPYFFLADGSMRFLESMIPTPIRTKAEIAPMVRDLLLRSEGGFRDMLRELFHTIHSWGLIDDPHAKDLVRVDEVAVLPGFGAFVSGWSLSPSKDADRFVLKAGNFVMMAEDRTVSRHARPDLGAIYPNVDLALERAGFTAVFRGDFERARLDELLLKAAWNDGTATNEAIGADKVRVLGLTTPLEAAARFYPAIEAEAFFPDFARHAAAGARARARTVKPYAVEKVAAAMVMVSPATASDVFLTFESAMRHAAMMPTDWGIAVLARSDRLRPLVISLFADLKRATGRACSLFFIAAADAATDALAGVLEALGAEHFAYTDATRVLTRAGWQAAGAAPAGLTLLEAADLANGDDAAIADLGAFTCDAATWHRIAEHAPPQIGGATLAIVPREARSDAPTVPGAAIALAIRRPSSFVARINAVAGAGRG